MVAEDGSVFFPALDFFRDFGFGGAGEIRELCEGGAGFAAEEVEEFHSKKFVSGKFSVFRGDDGVRRVRGQREEKERAEEFYSVRPLGDCQLLVRLFSREDRGSL